jgi:hypothetical protein
MISRQEMLAEYLGILDEINQSTHLALDTLSKNADTTRIIIDELINGEAEASPIDFNSIVFQEDDRYIENEEEDTIETLSDKIVEQIEANYDKPGIRAIDIGIDPDKFDTFEVMDMVRKKMQGDFKKKEEKKEETNDDFNFENPLE